MDCQHLEDLYELYLLGGLAGNERHTLDEHLRASCPRCLPGLREAAETLFWLVHNSSPARPRPALRTRLVARLAAAPARAAAARKPRAAAPAPPRPKK